jgi:hypothetical protein
MHATEDFFVWPKKMARKRSNERSPARSAPKVPINVYKDSDNDRSNRKLICCRDSRGQGLNNGGGRCQEKRTTMDNGTYIGHYGSPIAERWGERRSPPV